MNRTSNLRSHLGKCDCGPISVFSDISLEKVLIKKIIVGLISNDQNCFLKSWEATYSMFHHYI